MTQAGIQRPGIISSLSGDQTQGKWMVLWTKSRQEKEVARYLAAMELTHYLPLVKRVSVSRGRKSVSQVPLFPGYVFLSGEAEDAYGAVANGRVCKIIPVDDQERFVRELTHIRMAMAGEAHLELYPFAVVGRRCRVRKGPLMGLEGVITDRGRRGRSNRLVLQVNVLGRGAALEIDIDLLEPLA